MGVHGVYKEELRKRHDLRLVMCHMLDRWYTTHLYKFKCGVNGLQELKHVLSHTELKYLISAFVDEFQDDETIKNLTQQVQDLLKQIESLTERTKTLETKVAEIEKTSTKEIPGCFTVLNDEDKENQRSRVNSTSSLAISNGGTGQADTHTELYMKVVPT